MLVLGIDAGTSSCKVGIFSEEGPVAIASRDLVVLTPEPGQAVLDPHAVWRDVRDAVREVVAASKNAGHDPHDVRAISFSSMGEATVPVRLDRSIVGPSILAYDNRGARYADELAAAYPAETLYAITPNAIGPHYTLSKFMWLKEYDRALYDRADKFLFWADFLAFMFGAPAIATPSLANRSLLLDVKNCRWSPVILAWSKLDREKLGELTPAGKNVGVIEPGLARELGLSPGVRIVAGGHDQCANALGSGCAQAGTAVVGMGTYETYCPVFTWPEGAEGLGKFRREGMNIEHHVVDGLYASFLYHHSGLLINWFRRTFAPELTFPQLNREIPDEPSRVLFLPHNEPPQWPRFIGDTSGVFAGLKTGTSRGEMYRAVMEGVTFYLMDAVEAMRKTGVCPAAFQATGGGSRSDAWMQIRADITGVPFTRLEGGEGSLTGAAMLAGVAAGMFGSVQEAAGKYIRSDRTFSPDPRRHAGYRERLELYRRLYPAMAGLLKDMG